MIMSDIFISYQRSDEAKAEMLLVFFKWPAWRDQQIPTAARFERFILVYVDSLPTEQQHDHAIQSAISSRCATCSWFSYRAICR
jgi:hypothetical protein